MKQYNMLMVLLVAIAAPCIAMEQPLHFIYSNDHIYTQINDAITISCAEDLYAFIQQKTSEEKAHIQEYINSSSITFIGDSNEIKIAPFNITEKQIVTPPHKAMPDKHLHLLSAQTDMPLFSLIDTNCIQSASFMSLETHLPVHGKSCRGLIDIVPCKETTQIQMRNQETNTLVTLSISGHYVATNGLIAQSDNEEKPEIVYIVKRLTDTSCIIPHCTLSNDTRFYFSSKGGYSASHGLNENDITFYSIDLPECEEYSSTEKHGDYIISGCFNTDDTMFATCSKDATIKLWCPETADLIATLKGHTDAVHLISFSPDGRLLASYSRDNSIKIWNINTGLSLHTIDIPSSQNVTAFYFDEKSNILAYSSNNTILTLIDIEKAALLPLKKQLSLLKPCADNRHIDQLFLVRSLQEQLITFAQVEANPLLLNLFNILPADIQTKYRTPIVPVQSRSKKPFSIPAHAAVGLIIGGGNLQPLYQALKKMISMQPLMNLV